MAARLPGTDVRLGAALAIGLGIVSFAATGGTTLGSNTWTEIAITITGAGLAATAVLAPARGPAWGAPALLLFVALGAWTAASISWSVQPADSWVEANRTLAYIASFGAAIALARLMPGRWAAVIGAVAVVSVVVSGYALLVKVFPATLDAGDVVGRLRLPFDYANAVGQMAAMGVPACLWAGSRREGGWISRVLAVPALGVLTVTIMLSYSRGALLIVTIGLIVWFALVPLRLRAALVLALGAVGGGAATVWALAHHPIDARLQHASGPHQRGSFVRVGARRDAAIADGRGGRVRSRPRSHALERNRAPAGREQRSWRWSRCWRLRASALSRPPPAGLRERPRTSWTS